MDFPRFKSLWTNAEITGVPLKFKRKENGIVDSPPENLLPVSGISSGTKVKNKLTSFPYPSKSDPGFIHPGNVTVTQKIKKERYLSKSDLS